MTHEQAIELLSASLDRSLTPGEQSALDAWIAADPDHRILADGLRHQHQSLKATFEPRREAITNVVQAVTSNLAPRPTPATKPSRWRKLFTPVPAGIAAAVIVGIAIFTYKGDQPKTITSNDIRVAANDSRPTIGLMPQTKPSEVKSQVATVGDDITTKAGEKRRLVLPDGSILYVNQLTNAKLVADRHLKLSTGEVFVEAIPASMAKTKFLVETPNRSVTALGTKFAVAAVEAGTGVIVTQGKVEVSSISEPINTGEQLKPTAMKASLAPRAACAVEWTRDLMIAAESPLVPAGKHSGGSLVAVDPYGQESKLSLVKFHVDVHIEGGFARTTIDQTYFNHENQQLEGTFYFPLPPDASLNRLVMYVEGNRMEGGMAEREHARDVYETIRHQRRDPALLEWVDGSVFKMRVFPLAAREEKRILMSYTQRLNSSYGRSTYRFPSGHTLSHVNEWSFQGLLTNAADTSVISPSHPAMKMTPNGSDIKLTDAMKNTRIDRDIVIEMHDHQEVAKATESSEFTEFTQDGERYMLMKYKPELPMNTRRERRDWVFLFESSGERNPLVARTQIETIRAMLNHVEHEDTFSVLTVGTRIHTFSPELLPATKENAAQAISWLEKSHLIGALNIADAFSEANNLLKNARNPHVVHVGSGIATYGEQRVDLLRTLLPAQAKYIGIAVGKRFSTTLMKATAEKTGGLFININPDEAISWRGFEITSMLNAPRLLNISLSVPSHPDLKFLPFSESVAHGEELLAIARVTKLHIPTVKVMGLVDGQEFKTEIPVKTIKPGAGHLPRSWAKLEIDRMLTENVSLHRHTIIELSKQMYVMTPFTSLLVLENEQMYRDFKVDRGRKDHWAMYPAPDKIPVVFIPDPNNPNAVRGAIAGQKPHENQVLATIFTRTPAQVLQGPNIPGQPSPVQSAGEKFGMMFITNPTKDHELFLNEFNEDLVEERFANQDFLMDGNNLSFEYRERESEPLRSKRQQNLTQLKDLKDQISSKNFMFGTQPTGKTNRDLQRFARSLQETDEKILQQKQSIQFDVFDRKTRGTQRGESRVRLRPASGDVNRSEIRQTDDFALTNEDLGLNANLMFDTDGSSLSTYNRLGRHWDFNGRLDQRKLLEDQIVSIKKFSKLRAERNVLAAYDLPALVNSPTSEIAQGGEVATGKRNWFAFHINEPAYYNRPTFAYSERLFRDLVSHAPGMSSLAADVKAVLEAEAAPRFGTKRGKIDPAARQLIETARQQMGWRITEFAQRDGKILAITHDGLGRYRYERLGRFGLKEFVVCDGTHLWHSYPELGIGAKRTVSRFHRAEFYDLIADGLPPAEDMNYGADIVLVNATTAAVVPHHDVDDDGNPRPWVESHYTFTNGRFSQSKVLVQPSAKLMLTTVYHSDGQIVMNDSDGKEITKSKLTFRPTTAPTLTPDNQSLVVLPLPLRTRSIVYPKIGLDPNYGLFDGPNPCWVDLNEEAMLELLASELGTGSNSVANITSVLWHNRGDHRPGYNVLRAAVGQHPLGESDESFEQKLVREPVTRYLHREFDEYVREMNRKFGFALPAQPKDDFLSRLQTLRMIYDRFTGNYTNHTLWGIRDGEIKRAINYVRLHPESVLSWAALGLVANVSTTNEMYQLTADTWGLLIDKSPFPYAARYEQARSLVRAGKSAEAMKKFQTLFREALAVGVLPPVDAIFRGVQQEHSPAEWPNLMREMAASCVEKKARPVVVLLAWQCWQLGDVALSDTMLDMALKNASTTDEAMVTLWAVQFLHRTNRHDRAEMMMSALLRNEKHAQSPSLWRLGYHVANAHGDQVTAIERLEKALDLEYQDMPETFDINPIRQDYSLLMNHYDWLADAARKLNVPTPKDLPSRIVKNMDRWRHLDAEADGICQRAGATLRKIGGTDAKLLAWDYETTPLALKPNESGPWENLANTLRSQSDWQATDRAYELAYLAEPTNAQLLWNRAQHLKDKGQLAQAQQVFKQLADGKWQDRFASLVTMAKAASEGR